MGVSFSCLTLLLPSPWVLVVSLCALLGYCVLRWNLRPAGHPPGPPSLPVLGSFLSLAGGDMRDKLLGLAEHYGDVFMLDLGARRTVVLASYEAIREGLVQNAHALSGRPQDMILAKVFFSGKGIVTTEGQLWSEQRKFAYALFREFGVGRSEYEENVQKEVGFLIQALHERMGEALDMSTLLGAATSNVTNTVIFGHRFDYKDPSFLHLLSALSTSVSLMGNMGVLAMFPFLTKIPGDLFGFDTLRKGRDSLLDSFRKEIAAHKSSRTPGEVNDLIDAFLEEAERQKDNPATTFNDTTLMYLILDMFAASTETTTSSISWFILLLLHNPGVMRRAQQEVHDVIGPTRMPSMTDKVRMPYMEAVLLEMLRFGEVTSLGIMHKTLEDVTLKGYTIPAGMDVMPMLLASHRDPKVWKEPSCFLPERFLNDDGQFVMDKRVIPFSMGRRVCPGENIARMEMFIFAAALLQHFRFRCPPEDILPEPKAKLALVMKPQHYRVVLQSYCE